MNGRSRWTDMAEVGEGDDSGQETQDGLVGNQLPQEAEQKP